MIKPVVSLQYVPAPIRPLLVFDPVPDIARHDTFRAPGIIGQFPVDGHWQEPVDKPGAYRQLFPFGGQDPLRVPLGKCRTACPKQQKSQPGDHTSFIHIDHPVR
jgi:hypothetical protein